MMRAAIPTQQSDTPEARVTRWHLPPGSATGHHRHEYDYVIVPVIGGTMTIVSGSGRNPAKIEAGVSYFRKAGVEHDVLNETDRDIVFVEVEIKPR
jgi:quercetin dioxygenase-like cupin family protein